MVRRFLIDTDTASDDAVALVMALKYPDVHVEAITVVAAKPDGTETTFETIARTDSPVEVEYFKNGGILPTVLRRLVNVEPSA